MAKSIKRRYLAELIEARSDKQTTENANLPKRTIESTDVGTSLTIAVERSSRSTIDAQFANLDRRQVNSAAAPDATTKRMSLYLDPHLYWRISDYAHRHRTKMHPIIVRGLQRMMDELEADASTPASR
jgi:hypothetical protein